MRNLAFHWANQQSKGEFRINGELQCNVFYDIFSRNYLKYKLNWILICAIEKLGELNFFFGDAKDA